MRTITLCVGLLLIGTPGFAQSKVYTNRDLTPKPVTAWTRTVTPAELAGLQARAFQLPPDLPDGPTVIIVSTREVSPTYPTIAPLAEPWSMTTYYGRRYGRGFGRSSGGHVGPASDRPGIHLRYP